jgi:hypothetical protein
MSRSRTSLRLAIAAFAAALSFAALSANPKAAHALPDLTSTMGARGQLSIDQISGFRVGTDGGLTYYGPIGFSARSYNAGSLQPNRGDTTFHYTTFWLAPSADYFIIDNLSVGGLLELSTTSSSVDFPTGNGATQNVSQPTTTSITILPRAGYLIGLSDRFAIWPRGGLGYISRQAVNPSIDPARATKDSFGSFIMDIDVGFLFRLSDTLYLKAAPELTFSLGGSHSVEDANVTRSASASIFQFAMVSGVGGFFDL